MGRIGCGSVAIAVWAVAGCLGSGGVEEVCSLALPQHGLRIQIVDAADPALPAGNYRLDITADDLFESVALDLPAPPDRYFQRIVSLDDESEAIVALDDAEAELVVELRRQTGDGTQAGQVFTGPEAAEVAVFLDGRSVGQQSFEPAYSLREELGASCGRSALATDAMAIDTAP